MNSTTSTEAPVVLDALSRDGLRAHLRSIGVRFVKGDNKAALLALAKDAENSPPQAAPALPVFDALMRSVFDPEDLGEAAAPEVVPADAEPATYPLGGKLHLTFHPHNVSDIGAWFGFGPEHESAATDGFGLALRFAHSAENNVAGITYDPTRSARMRYRLVVQWYGWTEGQAQRYATTGADGLGTNVFHAETLRGVLGKLRDALAAWDCWTKVTYAMPESLPFPGAF